MTPLLPHPVQTGMSEGWKCLLVALTVHVYAHACLYGGCTFGHGVCVYTSAPMRIWRVCVRFAPGLQFSKAVKTQSSAGFFLRERGG